MRKWITADCETDPFNGDEISPFIWAAYDGTDTIIFNDEKTATADFLAYIAAFDGIVYAHNGGKFDWMFEQCLAAINPDSKLMLINGRIAKAKIGKCELRDSWLCLPVPLKSFEKAGFNYKWLTKANRKKMMPKIVEYIKSDVVNLYSPLARFFENHGQCLTQAGAALKCWEAMGGVKRRYSPDHDAIFRQYYFGGRVSVFKYCNGEKVIRNLYDVNSAYPYAMSKLHCLGTKFIKTRNLNKIVGSSFWTVKAVSKGCLPLREKNGAVIYPNDNVVREYKTCGWELLAGMKTGTLDIISGTGLIPAETESLKAYVDRFMRDKERAQAEGDIEGRTIAKIFLNSLYGKFACDPTRYKDYMLCAPDSKWALYKIIPCDNGTCRTISCKPSDYGQYVDIAIAASITSHARAELWKAICTTESPVYCDTDSVLASGPGSIKVGDNLGDWSIDAKCVKAWIAGKKMYSLELADGSHKIASKGVKAAHRDIVKACEGETVLIINKAPCLKLDGTQVFTNRRIKLT